MLSSVNGDDLVAGLGVVEGRDAGGGRGGAGGPGVCVSVGAGLGQDVEAERRGLGDLDGRGRVPEAAQRFVGFASLVGRGSAAGSGECSLLVDAGDSPDRKAGAQLIDVDRGRVIGVGDRGARLCCKNREA